MASDRGDVKKVPFPKRCPAEFCFRDQGPAFLKRWEGVTACLAAEANSFGCPYLLVGLQEALYAIELRNIGRVSAAGLEPEERQVAFCGELSLAMGQSGYSEAAQTFLSYAFPGTWALPVRGDVEYSDCEVQPQLDKYIAVDRPSASVFVSEYGALAMMTQTEVCFEVLKKLVGEPIQPAADLEV